MTVTPPKLLRVKVTNITPIATWDHDDGSGDPWLFYDYKWNITMIVDPQVHSYHLSQTPFEYNGLDVQVGDWVATTEGGIAVQISSIISKTMNSVTCEVEDVDRYNIFNDPSVSGVGIGSTGFGFVFELNDEGLPVLTPVAPGFLPKEFQTDLMSRFMMRNLKKRFVRVRQVSHGFNKEDVIWLTNSGTYQKAQANDVNASERVVGIVKDSFSYVDNANLDWFAFEPIGKLETGLNLPGQPGDLIYLSDTVAGGYTNIKPSNNARPIYIRLETASSGILVERGIASTGGSGAASGMIVVVDLTARNALTGLSDGSQVFVENNGNNEWAIYLWKSGSWTLISSKDSSVTDAQSITVSITAASSGEIYATTVSSGSRITSVVVEVMTAFDGTLPSILVGDDVIHDRLLGDADCDLSEVGVYETNPAHSYSTGGDTDIKVFCDPNASTVGSATVTVTYV